MHPGPESAIGRNRTSNGAPRHGHAAVRRRTPDLAQRAIRDRRLDLAIAAPCVDSVAQPAGHRRAAAIHREREQATSTVTRGSNRRSASVVAVRTVRTSAVRSATTSSATAPALPRNCAACSPVPPASRDTSVISPVIRSIAVAALRDIAGDFVGRRGLLLDRGGHRHRHLGHRVQRLANRLDLRRPPPSSRLADPSICSAISDVACAVWVASAFTSAATTAKPRPASPARAASIVAFSASRLVWLAMSAISRTTVLIRSPALASERIASRALGAFARGVARHRAGMIDLRGHLADRGRELLAGGGDDLRVLQRLIHGLGGPLRNWR